MAAVAGRKKWFQTAADVAHKGIVSILALSSVVGMGVVVALSYGLLTRDKRIENLANDESLPTEERVKYQQMYSVILREKGLVPALSISADEEANAIAAVAEKIAAQKATK